MTTYSYGQLEGLWINAGGDPSKAPLMAAIALAESGGSTTARNPSGATGLWQILVPVHGDLIRKYGDPTDPNANAKEAVSIYKSQGLSAWTTYTSGAYKRYLKNNVAPIGANAPNATPTSIGQGGSSDCCAIGFGGVNIPLAGNTGGFCLLSKTQVNSIFGTLLVGVGVLVGMTGVGWVLVYGVRKSGAANVLAALPGATGAVGKVLAAPNAASAVRRATPARATDHAKVRKPQGLKVSVGEPKQAPSRPSEGG